jgi:transglutaminase-like putative cysteine protease/thioredoxin-like negative regulator of GroEL
MAVGEVRIGAQVARDHGTAPSWARLGMKLRLSCRPLSLALCLAMGAALSSSFVAAQSPSFAATADRQIAAPANPYDRELAEIESKFPAANPPGAAVLLRRAYKLRDYVDGRPVLEQWIASVAADPTLHPLVRDEALYLSALVDRHRYRLDEAGQKLRQLGFVRQWAIVGPFRATDIDTPLGPEQGWDPDRTYSGGACHWRDLPDIGPHSAVSLRDFYSLPGSIAAFAATSIYSGVPQQAAVRFSSSSAAVVWINGVQVFKDTAGGTFGFDQHAVALQLRAGWNQVLLKLLRADGQHDWHFSLRLTGLHGGGLTFAVNPRQPWAASASAALGAISKPDDLVGMAEAEVRTRPGSAEALETLANIELAHGTGSPATHMEAATQLRPSASRFYQLAQMQTAEAARFQSLNAALDADPHFAPARLALADYYVRRKQLEKAASLLRDAIAASTYDFVGRTRLADVYAAAGFKSRAAKQYAQIAADSPLPLWVKREIAQRWADFGLLNRALALLGSALSENADGPAERALAIKIAERRGDTKSLRTAYEFGRRLFPNDTVNLAKLAALEAGSGNSKAAASILRSAIAIDPASAGLHQQFAELLIAAGDARGAREQLARALEIDPQLETVRHRLELAEGKPADDPDAGYLVRTGELAAAVQHQARPPADSVLLADIRVQCVFSNDLSETHVQQVTYIGNDHGVREHATESIEYAPNSQQLHVLRARVYKPDGRIIEADVAGEKPVSEAGAAMYYDVRSRLFHFRELEKGDVIELNYRITPSVRQNPSGGYFGEVIVFQSPVAERLKRYVLITPANQEFHVHEERMPSAATIMVEGGKRIYRWEAHNLAALDTEPRGPAITELAPYVHVSTFGSWAEMGRWYAQLIRPQIELDSALRQALANLLANTATDEQKIRAIHQFVVRNTHYVALEFGIYSYRPYPVSETYARRFGDCKDKASLMVALLRAAGIDADLALVRTRRLGDIREQPASIAVFNHAVVYIPRYDLWLDGTAEYAGLHELPLEDQGAQALTVSLDGSARLRRIPVTYPGENYTRRMVSAEIARNGMIHFSGTTYTRGEDAPGLRREYEVAERQRQSFRDRLAQVFPSVRVDEVKVDGATDLDRDVQVDFRGELNTFVGQSSIALASSWMPRSYLASLAPLSARDQDLVLSAPWTTEEELRFALPAGARIAAVPADSTINTPFGSAELQYQRHENEISVHTRVQFRQTRVAPEQYAEFRDFCAQLERAFRQEIKVVIER